MHGMPLATIGVLLRHKGPMMTKRYAHLSPASLKAALAILQDRRAETKRNHTPDAKKAQG
jgi:hypothetical protein